MISRFRVAIYICVISLILFIIWAVFTPLHYKFKGGKMKRLTVFIIVAVLMLSGMAYAAPLVPISGATWVRATFDAAGNQVGSWESDLGQYVSDVPAQIIDGRVLVPMRFAIEPLGGSAEWFATKDGSSSYATFYAAPVKTVTVVETITNTIYVYVPIPLAPQPIPPIMVPPGTQPLTGQDYQIVSLINLYRANEGLPPLEIVTELSNIAMSHTYVMALAFQAGQANYLNHNGFETRFAQASWYGYAVTGENIASMGGPDTSGLGIRELKILEGWLNSPDTAASIFSADNKYMGIGAWIGAENFLIVTALFAN